MDGMATYAEKLRDSLVKVKTDELRYKDENGKECIQKAYEFYPTAFFMFNTITAGIALHLIKMLGGEDTSLDTAQKILLRGTMDIENMGMEIHIDRFLRWLLDQEATDDMDSEPDNPQLWYFTGSIVDLFNRYVTEGHWAIGQSETGKQ